MEEPTHRARTPKTSATKNQPCSHPPVAVAPWFKSQPRQHVIPFPTRTRSSLLLALLFAFLPSTAQVRFSEIMYHPVEETAFKPDGTPTIDLTHDVHEFIELHNPGDTPIPLAGWKIAGGIRFTFPDNTTLQPGQYLVIARDPARLAAIPAYHLQPSNILGPYEGTLGNTGDSLRLRNQRDEPVDAVTYSSSFPWAVGADALGADEEWTGLSNRDFQYRGRSLERISFTHDSNDPANWVASPVPGNPSPGQPNSIHRAVPLPVVINLAVYQNTDEQRLIRKNQPVRINATFSATNDLANVSIDYFIEDLNAATRTPTNVVMNATTDPTRFTVVLPGLPDRSVVRYRIKATRAETFGPVSPRPDDPFSWHAYYVTPARTSTKPIYDCFISTASLSRLATNINGNPKRVILPDPPGNPRPSWNATEPAIFVHDGVVRDIRMRYHGSRYNRTTGRNSFKWSFPRYNLFQGTDAIFETDKGDDFINGHGLFIRAGLPVSTVRYVDLYLNNNTVMQRLEQGEFNGDMLDAYHKTRQALNPGTPLEPSGEIYKSVGTIEVNGEGPYGRGDGRKLAKLPTWNDLTMYEWTYAIQSHAWRGHADFKSMVDDMWVARGDNPANPNANIASTRAFFEKYFDIDEMLTYIAVENWACPWDDTTQNHFLWRRSNGKWGMLPWDCDAWFGRGDNTPASASIFIGEVGDRSNNFRGPNFFKDGFLKAFRQEYKERLYLLNNTLLHPDNISAMGFGSIRSFANSRFTAVNTQCGFGTFERPGKPLALAPARGTSAVPNASLIVSPYTHSATNPVAQASSLWEIRSSSGSFQTPTFKLTTTGTNLTSLPIPFTELTFGETYSWRCTFIDAKGHPSIPSDESSFTFGLIPSSSTNTVHLIAIDTSTLWKYQQTATNLPAHWNTSAYDDSAWPSGPALLAAETAALPEPIRTPLALGQLTYYFRTRFNYSGPTTAKLQLRHVLDDGAVFYLNGRELLRTRFTANPALYTSLADSNVGDAVYEGPFDLVATNLVPGENLLAVEVHQSNAASSDIVFGMSLDTQVISTTSESLVLNEILANNHGASPATNGLPDYLELYNTSTQTIDLSGYSVSDDVLNPARFILPTGTRIAAHGFLRIWCDNATNAPDLHTGFQINADGQTLALFAPSTNGPALKDSVTLGPQPAGFSVGRNPDGVGPWQLNQPTPNTPNRPQPTSPSTSVRINEWLAEPLSGNDWFELHNSQTLPVSIAGLGLSDSLAAPPKTIFPPLSFIAANGFLVLNADGKPAKGPTHVDFKLGASGDTIALFSTNQQILDSVSFKTQNAGTSQGRLPDGAATVVAFPTTPTPGAANYLPLTNVLINEVLTHSDPPAEDTVELWNPSPNPVDITGWFLSDDPATPAKYRIPTRPALPPTGYTVLYESQFNASTNGSNAFAFSSAHGDHVVLSAANPDGSLTGFRQILSLGPAPSGIPFGRFPTSQGSDFTLLSTTSIGSEPFTSPEQFRSGTGRTNPYPRISPVVISQIMYHPADLTQGPITVDDTLHEFVELRNASPAPVPLHDPLHPTNTWHIRGGISFDLPQNLSLQPGESLVLVHFNPGTDPDSLASFRSRYTLPTSALLVGPYSGKLANDHDRIELLQPDLPVPQGLPDAGFVPHFIADFVEYHDSSPWPPEADGTGQALHRIALNRYGNEPLNWQAGPPSPGKSSPRLAIILSIGPGPTLSLEATVPTGTSVVPESTDNLLSPTWSALSNPVQPDATGHVKISQPLAPSVQQRYFRLRLQP